jgi:hypothetical protein
MKLFLDDERQPKDVIKYYDNDIYWDNDWILVKNYSEFVDYISNHKMPEIISFDHDLSQEHYKYASADNIPYSEFKTETGYHCLLYLILFCNNKQVKLPEILIHTMSITGYNNLKNLIETYKLIAK